MITRKIFCIGVMIIICFSVIGSAASAAELSGSSTLQLVQVAPKLIGQLYLPDAKSELKHIGILITHPNFNFFNHSTAIPLAERGFTVLVSNTRYTDDPDAAIVWEDVVLDTKSAFEYLKAIPGIEKIVLIGHSAAAPLVAFYQNIAENGVQAGQGKEKIYPTSDKIAGLSKADALILLDPHPGYGFQALMNKDPSVVVEGAFAPEKIDASLDMYSEQNGFSPQGTNFDEAWKKKFYAAQAERNQRVVTYALERLKALENGNSTFSDTEPFVVPRNYARLFVHDLSAMSHSKGVYPVLTVNGVREEVVHSVRAQGRNNVGQLVGEAENVSYANGTMMTDIRTYLGTFAIRADSNYELTEDDIIGVDFASANSSTPTNLTGVHVPVLLMGMTGHYWIVSSEINYNHTAASDKTLVFVEGAAHMLNPSKPEYGDTVGMIADYVKEWLVKRFM